MMAIIGPDLPVLWTTTKTLHDRGPYQNAHMQSWTQALTDVCARNPRMRVYDWASEVHDDWFGPDGIHPGRAGYRERAARIARARGRFLCPTWIARSAANAALPKMWSGCMWVLIT